MLNGTLRLVGAPKRAGWDDRIERLARRSRRATRW